MNLKVSKLLEKIIAILGKLVTYQNIRIFGKNAALIYEKFW